MGATEQVEETVLGLAHRGIRSLAVSCTDHNSPDRWVFMGIMTFLDPPRPDTKITIQRCKEFGVVTKMITGDHKAIAVEMCKRLNMGTNVLGADNLPVKTPEELESDSLGREFGPMIIGADGFAQVCTQKCISANRIARPGPIHRGGAPSHHRASPIDDGTTQPTPRHSASTPN